MIIKLFKNSQTICLVIIPVAAAAAWLIAWQGHSALLVENPMPLYNIVMNVIDGWPGWVVGITGFILCASQVFHLNYVVNKHEVLYKNSYLPALFFLAFLIIIPQFLTFNPVLLVNSILIIILDKLFKLYKNTAPMSLVFDTCFLSAVATLIYLPAIVFVLLAAFAILILKTFSWRDLMVGAIGFLLPFFFAFVYYFWVDGLYELQEKLFLKNIRQLWDTSGLVLQGYRITLGLVTIMFTLTIIRIRQNFYKNATRIRNFQQVIFIFLGISLLSLAVTALSVAVYRFTILAIPLSIMISYYFLAAKKNWWVETLFWMMVGTLVFNYINIF